MRIADKMNYEQVTSNLGRNRSEMSELQNQAALQKKVTKPSDDPLGAARVLNMRTEINGNNQFLKSISNAKAFLEYSEESLGELSEVLIRAKELAINQANDASAGPKSRELVASEVTQLHAQTVQIGNRKLADRFLFGGFRTTQPPFDPEGQYHGDNGSMEIIIDKEAKLAMNIPGNLVFLGRVLKAPADAGPDSSQNPQKLENPEHLQNLSRSSAPADSQSKIKPGSEKPLREYKASPTQDYELPALRAPAQEKKVGLASAEDLSRKAAEREEKLAERGINIFKTLKSFETALRTNDKPGIQESIDKLDTALEQVVLSRAELGSRIGTLNAATDSISKGTIDARTMASNIEDADTFQLVSEINKSESALKATLATSGKLVQPSLLDFLR